MLKFYKKLENKFYKYSIPGLYKYIVIALIIGYFLCYIFPNVFYYLPFNPYEVVINHQYWRCFTWIFDIPFALDTPLNRIFLPISLYFYYFVGKSLEMVFGKFSYNFYFFGGWFLATIGMLFASFYMFYLSPDKDSYLYSYEFLISTLDGVHSSLLPGVTLTMSIGGTHYMLQSIFFAFALIYPEMRIRLWFVIPFKVKWFAWISAIILAYEFLQAMLPGRVVIIMFVLNFFIYYLAVRSLRGRSLKTIKRQMVYRNKVRAAQSGRSTGRTNADVRPRERNTNVYKMPAGKAIHKCAVCGRSEQDGENMEFRYCSKCNGDLEYCQDHLYTHQHVTGSPVNNENTNN